MSLFSIKVPASTANLGPGFDSAGIALSRYLIVHVEKADEWEFEHRSVHLPQAPAAEDHLIYQSALRTADTYQTVLSPCKVVVESEIPLARGLGSSASAVVAGIELANLICQLSLTDEEKLKIATDIEGHPDNVAAALYGGLVISAQLPGGEVEMLHAQCSNLELVVYIPESELKTADARKVLPQQFSRSHAAAASAIGNVMIAALLSNNLSLAGKMMEADLFHEPYRAELIPNYETIRQEAKLAGAYGTVISGAGPTMISFVPKQHGSTVVEHMQKCLPSYQVAMLTVDNGGLQSEIASLEQM